MLDTSNLSKFLKGITDAIRAKKGTTEPIEHKLIDEEIASIQSDEIKLTDYFIGNQPHFNFSDLEVEHLIIELPKYYGSTTLVQPKNINSKTKEITIRISNKTTSLFRLLYGSAYNYSVETINLDFDTSNATNFKQVINFFYNVKTINGVFDLSSATNIRQMFDAMQSLESLRFAKESIKISITIPQSELTDESIQSIIDGLAYVTSAKTLTLSKNVKARLTEEQIAIINEKGWTLA